MASATRSQVSIIELEKKFEDRHEELNNHLDQMIVDIERIQSLLHMKTSQHQNEISSTNNENSRSNLHSYSTSISKVSLLPEHPKYFLD
ncbi:hypothetical protein VNO78_20656 [Psophocarpus tetragonolobus]|uniref:Uncharacterized protein n=1 Tax=Psophocarpus tetragonolobus TaxID=3891 RepID=A0AAN9XHF0_PSOTE